MRYSFHGKVRATGQLVDGYVEAETSTEAIDRLADQGIIGVYSVRAEPKQPRNSVLLAGTPEFERNMYDDGEPQRKARRGLPQQPQPPQVYLPAAPVAAPPPPPQPVAVAVASPVAPAVSDPVMVQLVDKLSTLIGQMQKFLDRPAQVVYASGPAREGKGGGGKRAGRSINEAQNSTLKDIFQNNLDLRRSLAKLAETVTPAAGAAEAGPSAIEMAAPVAAGSAGSEDAISEPTPADAGAPQVPDVLMAGGDEEPPPGGGSAVEQEEMVDAEVISSSTDQSMDDGDVPLRVHDTDHAHQPAA